MIQGEENGECEVITGTLNDSPYFIWGMKERHYVMKIMAAGGGLEEDNTCRETYCGSCNERMRFKYKKPCDWYSCYCHSVDDHNNLCHALSSLEDT